MLKRAGVMFFVVIMLMSLALPAIAQPGNSQGQSSAAFDQRVVRNLDVDRAMEHLHVLTKDIGTRPGGLENEEIAAQYIADYFEDLGYDPWIQEFGVADHFIGDITVHGAEEWFGQGDWGFNEWHGTVWETTANRAGPFTGEEEEVSGYIVDCGAGGPDEWPEEVEGNIALMDWSRLVEPPSEAFSVIVERAEDAGAEGLLVYSLVGGRGQYGQTFGFSVDADIPVLGLAKAHGRWLQEMAEELNVSVDLQTFHYSDLISQNVIATKPAISDDAPIVVVGGHYDSVVGAPGANDNGSGTVTVMELARVLKKFNTDDYELRFALWGSEERGLLGARHYVNQLSDEDLDRHVAKYNIDMVATSEYERAPTLFLETVDGEPNIVTDSALDAADRLGYVGVEQSQFPASDHVPFHFAGIPAAMFIWLGGAGTPWDYTIERFYHTPQDTIEENICVDRLEMVMEIAGSAVHDLVRKPVPALERAAIRSDYGSMDYTSTDMMPLNWPPYLDQ